MPTRHLTFAFVLGSAAIAVLPACAIEPVDDPNIERVDRLGLYFVAPDGTRTLRAGDAVEFTVRTWNPAARRVTFAVDGHEIGACDEDDCRCFRDDAFRATFAFTSAGEHVVLAFFDDTAGHRVFASQTFEVTDRDAPSRSGEM
jgi:hypothetical protein